MSRVEVTDEMVERFHDRYMPEPNSGCFLWLGAPDKDGYGKMRAGSKTFRAHQFSFLLAHNYLPSVVRHSCDNPACVNPAHLRGGTHQDNVADKVLRDRCVRRAHHPAAKLTENQVKEIRAMQPYRGMAERFAELFGVNPSTIQRVIKGERWK